jgi:hypothetical protein
MALARLKTGGAIATLLPVLGLGFMPSGVLAQIMDKQVAKSDADMPTVQYLDDLQECVASSQSPPLPLPLLEGVMAASQILGWADETCVVETKVFLATAPETQTTMSYCQYTPATIAIMTDEVAYEQARTGNFSFSTDNERDMALSTAIESECEFNFEWFEELTGVTP